MVLLLEIWIAEEWRSGTVAGNWEFVMWIPGDFRSGGLWSGGLGHVFLVVTSS